MLSWAEFHGCDERFHLRLAEATGIPSLTAPYSAVLRELYRCYLPYRLEALRESNAEHHQLLDALRRKDAAEAGEVARRHVEALHRSMFVGLTNPDCRSFSNVGGPFSSGMTVGCGGCRARSALVSGVLNLRQRTHRGSRPGLGSRRRGRGPQRRTHQLPDHSGGRSRSQRREPADDLARQLPTSRSPASRCAPRRRTPTPLRCLGPDP